jgi:hypothetical protein
VNTTELISALARGAGPAPRLLVTSKFVLIAVAGALIAAAMAVSMFGLVPVAMFKGAALWTKVIYAAFLAAGAMRLAERLARPAANANPQRFALLVVFAAMGVAAAWAYAEVPPEGRRAFVLGNSWAVCPWCVMLLSMPTLAAALWVLRGMAPVQPMLAGLAAGVLSGAIGALGYAFACPEASIGFVAVWYTLGIGLTGMLGAALGPWILRW